jgi:hypothetical protein
VTPLPPLHVAHGLPPHHAGRRRAGIRALTMIVESLEHLADDFPRVCAHDDAAVRAARAVNIAGIIDGLAQLMSRLGKLVDLVQPDTAVEAAVEAALEDTRVEAALEDTRVEGAVEAAVEAALEDTRSVIGDMKSLIEKCVIAGPAPPREEGDTPPTGSRCESQNIKRRLKQVTVRVTGLRFFMKAKENWTRLHAVVLPVLQLFNSATVSDDEIATYFEEHVLELAMIKFANNEDLTEDMFNYVQKELQRILEYMKQLHAMQRGQNTEHSSWKDAASYEMYTWYDEDIAWGYVFTARKLTMALLGLCNDDEQRAYVQARLKEIVLSDFDHHRTEKVLDECIHILDKF